MILRNHLDLSCPLTTPLYLLCETNTLPSSPNSPGASLHQTHGFLPPSVHFSLPSAILKTFGNVLTLLLTGPPSSLSATNTISSSCLLKKSTIPASYLQPPITQNVFGKQSINSYTANLPHCYRPLLLALHLTHIGPLLQTDHENSEFLKFQDGGGHRLETYKNRIISATVWLICMKFGMVMHICPQNVT